MLSRSSGGAYSTAAAAVSAALSYGGCRCGSPPGRQLVLASKPGQPPNPPPSPGQQQDERQAARHGWQDQRR
jgi:hypothetical protein